MSHSFQQPIFRLYGQVQFWVPYCTNKLSEVFYLIIQDADDCTLIIPYCDISDLQKNIDFVSNNIFNYFSSLDLHLNTAKNWNWPVWWDNFRFDHHINNFVCPNIKRLYSSLFQLRKVTNIHNKHLIFNAYILPHILCCIPFALNINEKSHKKLSQTYKKAIKILFNFPKYFPSNELF